MAAMIRAHDWTGSPLGVPDAWAAPLKATLALVLDSIGPTWLVWGPDLTFLYNDAHISMLGTKHPAALGRPMSEVWAEIWSDVKPLVERTLAGEPVLLTDLPLQVERGEGPEQANFTFSFAPIRDESGVIQGFFCAVIETTARVAAGERRDVAEAALRKRNVSLEQEVADQAQDRALIWQVSRDMLMVSDAAGVWLSVNPAWTTCLGWTAEELVGRTSEWLEHPDDKAKTRAEIAKLAEGATTLAFDNRFRTREGGYRQLSWTAVPQGNRFYCVARDVTEERAQAASLIAAEEAMRQSQKMEAVGQLTGGVAHDFNNLLTVIKSSSDLLKRPDLPEERRARYVAAISDTVDRASKLTGQLLAFARRQALQPVVFAACDSVRGLADMMGTLTGSRVRITANLPTVPCYVNADPSQFDTALVNLAVNARDAMNSEGRIAIKVESVEEMPAIRAHKSIDAPYVAISLSDTGTGMPADMLGRIFEPFFTTKETGKGTGLGLSQVFGFAKQSGGDITVESTVGEGTTFTVYLPRVPAPGEATAVDVPATLADGHGTRVLVVEDNTDVGTFAVQTLSDLGYITVLAADGPAALAELASNPERFDVVFSDVMMPGMSGIELGQEIRRLYGDMPMVLTSGYSHILAQNGTYGFELLHKPYSIEQLSQILRKVANRQHRKQSLN